MGKRAVKWDEVVGRVADELRKGSRSAHDLQGALGCSRPTVYAWIEQLKTRGYGVTETTERRGVRGPKAVIYTLTSEPTPTAAP